MKTVPALFTLAILLVTGCTTLSPERFESSTPAFDPIAFFTGRTHSTGVREARNGRPSLRVTTQTEGAASNGLLHIEQDLFDEKGTKNHRSFQIRAIDKNHLEGTGSDMEGKTVGELHGNYFTWSFRLKTSGHGLVRHVSMTQHMYLAPDGTLVIRSIIRKFGVIVQEITEHFQKV